MMLEAVWLKNGEEVYKVSPVMNIVCYKNMRDFSYIEISDENEWHLCEDADDFIIRVKKD